MGDERDRLRRPTARSSAANGSAIAPGVANEMVELCAPPHRQQGLGRVGPARRRTAAVAPTNASRAARRSIARRQRLGQGEIVGLGTPCLRRLLGLIGLLRRRDEQSRAHRYLRPPAAKIDAGRARRRIPVLLLQEGQPPMNATGNALGPRGVDAVHSWSCSHGAAARLPGVLARRGGSGEIEARSPPAADARTLSSQSTRHNSKAVLPSSDRSHGHHHAGRSLALFAAGIAFHGIVPSERSIGGFHPGFLRLLIGGFGADRKGQREGRASPRRALHPDLAVVRLDDAPGNRQAQPALCLGGEQSSKMRARTSGGCRRRYLDAEADRAALQEGTGVSNPPDGIACTAFSIRLVST